MPNAKPEVAPPLGLVLTNAPEEDEAKVSCRLPPDTPTFEALVETLFMLPPPNQVDDHLEPSRLLPLNSSSKANELQPEAPVVVLPMQGVLTPPLVQPPVDEVLPTADPPLLPDPEVPFEVLGVGVTVLPPVPLEFLAGATALALM